MRYMRMQLWTYFMVSYTISYFICFESGILFSWMIIDYFRLTLGCFGILIYYFWLIIRFSLEKHQWLLKLDLKFNKSHTSKQRYSIIIFNHIKLWNIYNILAFYFNDNLISYCIRIQPFFKFKFSIKIFIYVNLKF